MIARRQPVGVVEEPLAGGLQLERETRVDDVAARQPEVEVAPLRADGLGDLADEGDDVVVGGPLDLGDALDVDARPVLDRREHVRRDEAARRLHPRDGELDPEHRLEARLVRPDRAHLGERVAADHRTTSMVIAAAAPRCRGGAAGRPSVIVVRRALGLLARAPRGRPAADDREHATAGGAHDPVLVDGGPGVEDQRAGRAPPRRAPRSGRPGAAVRGTRRRRGPPRPSRPGARAAGHPRARARARHRASSPRAAAEQQRPERDRETRQQGLRLRIAEPGVALEEDRAVRRSASGRRRARHGTAIPRRASSARIGRWNASTRAGIVVVGEVGERAVGAHPAGVRALVAVAEALVVAGQRQGQGVAAVAQGDEAGLRAVEPLLDDHDGPGRRQGGRQRPRRPAARRRTP